MAIENSVSNDFYLCSSIVLMFSIADFIIIYISDEVIKDINYKERLDNTVERYEHRSREKGTVNFQTQGSHKLCLCVLCS